MAVVRIFLRKKVFFEKSEFNKAFSIENQRFVELRTRGKNVIISWQSKNAKKVERIINAPLSVVQLFISTEQKKSN